MKNRIFFFIVQEQIFKTVFKSENELHKSIKKNIKKCSRNNYDFKVHRVFLFVCRFCFVWSCGCVMSERALKEIKSETCHKVCNHKLRSR